MQLGGAQKPGKHWILAFKNRTNSCMTLFSTSGENSFPQEIQLLPNQFILIELQFFTEFETEGESNPQCLWESPVAASLLKAQPAHLLHGSSRSEHWHLAVNFNKYVGETVSLSQFSHHWALNSSPSYCVRTLQSKDSAPPAHAKSWCLVLGTIFFFWLTSCWEILETDQI